MIDMLKLSRLKARATEASGDAASAVGVVAGWSGKMTVEGDGRTVQAVANTDDIDLDDEVVVPSGLTPGYFAKNKSVFVDHMYDMGSYVGQLRELKAFPGEGDAQRGWLARVHMVDTPLGNDVLTLCRETGLGVSIGFRATDYGPPTSDEKKRYTRNGITPKSVVRAGELLELSFTAMPANVSCRTLSIGEAKSAAMDQLDRLVVKGRIRRETAAAMGLTDAQKRTIVFI